jgi:hypothetical protein
MPAPANPTSSLPTICPAGVITSLRARQVYTLSCESGGPGVRCTDVTVRVSKNVVV